MQDKITNFLIDIGFYPICNDKWESFIIKHVAPESIELEKETFDYIKKQVGNKSGIYVYATTNEEILYIGKGNPLFSRLKSHYIESYRPVPGDRSGRFHAFFSSNQGEIKIYWKELDNELYRQIVEIMLKTLYTPKFFA